MGNSIHNVLSWSPEESVKLESTPVNDVILYKIVNYVFALEREHALESKFVFREPLVWNTTLDVNDLLQSSGFTARGNDVVSDETDKNGNALITMFENPKINRVQIKANNLQSLAIIFKIAESKLLPEIIACVEANSSPMSAIMSSQFEPRDTVKVIEDIVNGIVKQQLAGNKEQVTYLQTEMRLYLLLKQFGEELLTDFVKHMEVEQGPDEESDFHKMLRALIHGRSLPTYDPVGDELRELIHGRGLPVYDLLQAQPENAQAVRDETRSQASLRELIYGHGLPVYDTAAVGALAGDETRSQESLRKLVYGRGMPVYDIATVGAFAENETRCQASLRKLIHGQGMPVYDASLTTTTNEILGYENISPASLQEIVHGHGLPFYDRATEVALAGDEITSEAELRELIHGRGLPVYDTATEVAQPGDETSSQAELRDLIHGRGMPFYGSAETESGAKHVYSANGCDEHVRFIDDESRGHSALKPPPQGGRRATPARLKNLLDSAGDKEIECKKLVKPPLLPGENRKKTAVELWLEESSSEEEDAADDDEDEEDDEPQTLRGGLKAVSSADLTDHWYIQKLIKYIKSGDDAVTLISLCSLRDINLYSESCQMAIIDSGGLELLINLLETSNPKCISGALHILTHLTTNKKICLLLKNLGGVRNLLNLLRNGDKEVQALAAEAISNFGRSSAARKILRVNNGVMTLVGLLDINPEYIHLVHLAEAYQSTKQQSINTQQPSVPERVTISSWPGELPHGMESRVPHKWRKEVYCARAASKALYSSAVSRRNRMMMQRDGIMPLIARLLKSDSPHLLVPVVGIVNQFAKERMYVTDIVLEGMVADLVRALKSDHAELLRNAARAIFKCAEDSRVRDIIRECGGLARLVEILYSSEMPDDLLLALTGAVWKLSLSRDNVESLQKLGIIPILVNLLHDRPEKVVTRVVGALTEYTRSHENRELFFVSGGMQPLLSYQMVNDASLLVNVNNTIANCALHKPSLGVIANMDAVRLLWSVLKHSNPEVQASAAWAICPCIELIPDSAELVRSLVGGLELLVKLLKSDNFQVLASACKAIATIANGDEENLAVMTDQGVITALARLTCTGEDTLRENVAEAVAVCCGYSNNRLLFGKEGVVVPIVGFLRETQNANVHRATARALHELSKCPENCITMHRAGAIRLLVPLVGFSDHVMPEAASGCIYNVRRLLLANQASRSPRRAS